MIFIVKIAFILLQQKKKLEYHKIVCDFCNAIMPSKGTKILEFNKYQKSDKSSF